MGEIRLINFKILPINQYVEDNVLKWDMLFNTSYLNSPFYHSFFLEGQTSNTNLNIIFYEENGSHKFGFICKFSEKNGSSFCEISGPDNIASDHLCFLDSSQNLRFSNYFINNFKSITNCTSLICYNGSKDLVDIFQKNKSFTYFVSPQIKCPILNLSSLSNDIISSLSSKKFRANLRQSEKKAAEAGINFNCTDKDYDGSNMFNSLVELHKFRIETQNKNSQFLGNKSLDFHKRLNEPSKLSKEIIKYFYCTHQEKIIGIIYGFQIKQVFYFYQSGFNPNYEKFSIGSLVLLNAIKTVKKNNIASFDFLRGADTYKKKWTGDYEYNYLIIKGFGLKSFYPTYREKLRFFSRKYGKAKGIINSLLK